LIIVIRIQVGLDLDLSEMRHVFTSNSRMPKNKHYVTVFMLARKLPGTSPVNLEPDKCEGWLFMSWEELKAAEAELFMPMMQFVHASDIPPWIPVRTTGQYRDIRFHWLAAAAAGAATALVLSAILRRQ
jgi:hypothetical protein